MSPSLYELACWCVARNADSLYSRIPMMTRHIVADIISELHSSTNFSGLSDLMSQPHVIEQLLEISHFRFRLHRIYQDLKDLYYGSINQRLVKSVKSYMRSSGDGGNSELLAFGLCFGDFLNEAGWFVCAEKMFTFCLQLIQRNTDRDSIKAALACCARILRAQNSYCLYENASAMVECAIDMLNEFDEKTKAEYNKASLHHELSIILFAKSFYDEAFKHSVMALDEIQKTDTPISLVVDILRHCSKAFIIKRLFSEAEQLIQHALRITITNLGTMNLKFSDTLMDYGFYLLSIDKVDQAVSVYQQALDLKAKQFGGKNFHVALAHEELAYAFYVHEYSLGGFNNAIYHSQQAIHIFEEILTEDHLLLASSRRVKALVLEEVAIDSDDPKDQEELLDEALKLHESSLELAIKAFGEMNVQTAKHYGNLGRLYQTQHKYHLAEEMHLKAIRIKELLLGCDDYEVALSVGHLASLYNYDMGEFVKAEALYLRSIGINIKLFGEGYSGLEYDYRGLIRLYTEIGELEKEYFYQNTLHNWMICRESNSSSLNQPFDFMKRTLDSDELFYRKQLLNMCMGKCPAYNNADICFENFSMPKHDQHVVHT